MAKNKKKEYYKKLNKFTSSLPALMSSDVSELRKLLKPIPALQVLSTVMLTELTFSTENYKEIDVGNSIFKANYLTWIFITNKNQKILTGEINKEKKAEAGNAKQLFVQKDIYDQIEKLVQSLSMNSNFLELSKSHNKLDLKLDLQKELIARAKLWNTFVGSPGYDVHLKVTLDSLFTPFADQLEKRVGFSFKDLLRVEKFLRNEIPIRVQKRIQKSKKSEDEILDRSLKIKSGDVKPENDFDKKLLTLTLKQIKKMLRNLTVGWTWLGMEEALIFTPKDIANGVKLDITKVKNILERFSTSFNIKPIGNSFPSKYTLLETNPFIKISKDKYFCHMVHKFLSAIKLNLESLLKEHKREWEKYEKKRNHYAEKESIRLLAKSLGSKKYYNNLLYENGELDGLIEYDTALFLVEVKSGVMSDAARRGAELSLDEELSKLIKKPYDQAIRALKYINSSEEVAFSLTKRKTIIINRSKFSRIYLITVSLDDLGFFSANLPTLKKMGFLGDDIYPWAVYLEDLRVVTDILQGTQLVHYIQRRLRFNEFPSILLTTEIETLGFYLEKGLYFEEDGNLAKYDRTYYQGYGDAIDSYYIKKTIFKKYKTKTTNSSKIKIIN